MDNLKIQTRNDVRELLSLAIWAGEIMLKNGAETYRVEDTIERICSSKKNLSNISAFVTQTGIFLSVEFQSEVFTYLRRVKNMSIDLNKINKINEFSRAFVNTSMSIEDGKYKVGEIDELKTYSTISKATFGGLAASMFTLMFGGTIRDSISSLLISFIVIIILNKLTKFELTFFIDNFIGAFLASLLSYISIKLKIGENLDKIIIGSIMYLVPGVSITNAIRDTMSGDFLSGLSRGMEAVFSALAIALGVGIVLNFYLRGVI